jgi:hypothetical protein
MSCVFLCEFMGLARRLKACKYGNSLGQTHLFLPTHFASRTICSERVDAVLCVKSVFARPVSVIRFWYLFVAFLGVK